MPHIPRRRTKLQFTTLIEEKTFRAVEIIAIDHNVSMAEVYRRLIKVGLQCSDEGKTLFAPQEDD